MLLSKEQIVRLFGLKSAGYGWEDVAKSLRLRGKSIRAECRQVYLFGVQKNEPHEMRTP